MGYARKDPYSLVSLIGMHPGSRLRRFDASAEDTTQEQVELTAQGGVQFKAPKWIVTGPQKPDGLF